jgi:ferredoxin-NADP reductase
MAEGRLPVFTLTFAYAKDQKMDVRIDHGDVVKVVVPNYKPKSYSMSADRTGEFDITVKVYPGGRASGYLDSIQLGESISVFKHPACNKTRNPGSHVGFIAYGVGITEALPIAAAELTKSDAQKVQLLWASKTMEDTFWHEAIDQLKEEHGDRFEVAMLLSRQEKEGVLQGRVSKELLAEVFDGRWGTAVGAENESCRDNVRFLSVGTKDMMRMTDKLLNEIGYGGYNTKHALLR